MAVPAIPGDLRIGRGCADRSLFPLTQALPAFRRQRADSRQAQSRQPRRAAQRQHDRDHFRQSQRHLSDDRLRSVGRARRRRQFPHPAGDRQGRRPEHQRCALSQGHRSRHHAVDYSQRISRQQRRSAKSTTRSTISPNCSTKRCTSWCAPIPASPRSNSSTARRSISATSAAAANYPAAIFSAGSAFIRSKSTWGRATPSQKLKTGELAATILIAGKPTGLMGKLRAAQGLRFLPVAFAKPLQADYLPAVLSHADYPGMVEAGARRQHHRGQRGADLLTTGRAIQIAIGASPNSSDGSFRNWPICKSRRIIRNGARPISPPCCRAGHRFPAADGMAQAASSRRSRQLAGDARSNSINFWPARAAAATPATDADRDRLFQEFLNWQAHERP